MGGKEGQPVPYAKSWSIRAEWWLGCKKEVMLQRTGIGETAIATVIINNFRFYSSLYTTRKRLFISCFSLPNRHQLPYPSSLGAQPLQPLLPLSDITMDCFLPGIPFCLHPTTCTLVWLHKQVLHIFSTRTSSGLCHAHQMPHTSPQILSVFTTASTAL